MTPNEVVAVDLGGTHLRVARVARSGEILRHKRVETPPGGPGPILACVAKLAAEFQEHGNVVAAAGVAAPGPLDPVRGVVYETPNLEGFEDYPLAARWSERLGLTTYVNNDASLGALGEFRFGAGRDCDPMIYLTVSTGVGGGIILGGRIFEGAAGIAGELGHVIVAYGGPRCNFGHAGCLEALASGTAIAREARRRIESGEPSSIATAADATTTAEAVAAAAAAGDALALDVLRRAGQYLGAAVGGFVNIFDPRRVVIGGGVSEAWDLLKGPVRSAASEVIMSPGNRPADIVRAQTGDDAGLLGAAAYAFDLLEGENAP